MNFYHEANPVRSHGYKGFHKRNYENPLISTTEATPLIHDGKRTTKFIAKGIEKPSNALVGGLQYGSDQVYSRDERFNNRASPELIKLRQQQKLADEDIQAFKHQKTREREEAALSKKKDLEMLMNDYPWGRQTGGGAPRFSDSGKVDSRFRKQYNNEDSVSAVEEYNPFGRSGAGAPIKTTSGKYITSLQGDPDIRFQKQLKREVEQSLRYKDSRQQAETVETTQKQPTLTPSEIEMKLADKKRKELYARKLDEQRNDSQERSRVKRITESEAETMSFNPWGRDYPKRDDSGKIPRRQNKIDSKGVVDTGGSENGWWLNGFGSKQAQTRNIKHPDLSTNDKVEYHPWGRPGGGAPIKTTSGKIVTVLGKSPNKEQRGTDRNDDGASAKKNEKFIYRDGHGLTVAEWIRKPSTRKPLQECNNTMATSTISDCLPLLTDGDYNNGLIKQANQRQLGYQKQSKEERKQREIWPMSDIERRNHAESIKQKKYYDDLQKMVEEKQKQDELVRQKEVNEETKHVHAFSQLWGRPGGGAPRVNDNHEIDVSPRSYGALSTFMTHTGQHKFRRCN